MALSKESEEAFLECLRVLAPMHGPEERRVMARNVQSYIAEGRWIPALSPRDVAKLYYADDAAREAAFLEKMNAAIEAKELLSSTGRDDSLLAADLAVWPDCPPVPSDSPLRYWLPASMTERAQPTESTAAPVVAERASAGDAVQTPDPQRRLARLRELGGSSKQKGGEWTFTGITALVAAEKNEGRKRSDEKTIRKDLAEAAEAEHEEKRAGPWQGLGA